MLDLLKRHARLDGRALDEFRIPEISVGQPGYVNVNLGKTRVSAKISATITKPFEDRPFEGRFNIATETGPIAGPFFENNRQSDDDTLVSRLIEKAISRSGALDLEALCIVAGDKCWSVRADVHFLDFDGGFIDASCIAVIVGLLHFKKPDVTVAGEEIIVYPTTEREPVGLSVLHVPICVTFSFFNPGNEEENIKGDSNAEIAVIDATMTEEQLLQGSLTITVNKNKEICQILKSGGLPMDALTMVGCANKAYEVAKTVTELIENVLEKAK